MNIKPLPLLRGQTAHSKRGFRSSSGPVHRLDKRLFGRTVKLEIDWILRRIDMGATAWKESIVSQYTEGNAHVATEGAARNNMAQALGKISKLNL